MQRKTREQIAFQDGYILDYILDIGKRKNIYICIRDGKVTLKVPEKLSAEKAHEFLISKEHWIKENTERSCSKLKGFNRYEDGESTTLLGREYTLKIICSDKYFKPYFSENMIIAATSESNTEERFRLSIDQLIDEFTVNEINAEVKRLCKLTSLYPAKVAVKSMKSSWGRCSSSGNISINRDIIYHSRECLEYVIIHELCHLVHMNHSAEFWELVEKYCPDRKRIRKELNQQA